MISLFKVQLSSLGLLRLSLLALAIINILISIINSLLDSPTHSSNSGALWEVLATLVAPVMAPIFIVLIFLDFIMSKVRAADAIGDARQHYITISRIELLMLGIMFAYWVPFLMSFGR